MVLHIIPQSTHQHVCIFPLMKYDNIEQRLQSLQVRQKLRAEKGESIKAHNAARVRRRPRSLLLQGLTNRY